MVRVLVIAAVVAATLVTPVPARAATDLTAWEQWFIYELNRARWNPRQYAAEMGVSLPGPIGALPPLAPDTDLTAAARFKAAEMAAFDYFAHQSPITQKWPNRLDRDHGYDLFPAAEDDANHVESIWGGNGSWPTVATFLASSGHRVSLFAASQSWWWESVNQVGVGRATSGSVRRVAIHTARTDPMSLFVTGVAYDDANGNGRMDLGEGLPLVRITVGGVTVSTNAGGGYSIPMSSGAWDASASGPGFAGTAGATIRVGEHNVGVDFVSGNPEAEVRAFERCAGRRPTIMGTAGSDDLRGTSGNDIIHGLDGDDKIHGRAGDDILCGGTGRDVIRGGSGNDRISGHRGNDRLYGGKGNDTIKGDKGKRDRLFGGDGIDDLDGGPGDRDYCVGGSIVVRCEL
jgi:hypothetical protein